MKITYLFRENRPGNFSIEELFGNIASEVAKSNEVSRFTCKSADRINNLREMSKLNSDIFHITGDVNYLAFNLPKKKTIITVHDLGHFEKTLSGTKKLIYKQLWLNFPFKRAQKLTTISEFTKMRLVHHFNIPEEKIEVIHNPAPLHIFKKQEKVLQNERPKILQIGSGHNKNIENLIDAVIGLDVELMLIRKIDPKLKAILDSQKIKYQFFPNLSYEQVYQKYVDCDLVYFASNYEGFGVPILEAQAVGRPIITSTVASMPEIAGTGAHFVDYRSISEIKAGIIKICDDKVYAENLISKGYENVLKYSIENTVQKYINTYISLL